MKISCPVCSTSYMVPDTAIGEKGRKVKCASCGHQWHQDPSSSPSAAPVTDIQPDQKPAQVPAVVEYFPVSRKLVAATIIIFIFGYMLNNIDPDSDSFGFRNTDGLAFNSMDIVVKREDNKLVAEITGEIRNESKNDSIELPKTIDITLLSEQKRVMAETTYELPEKTLEPGESVDITPLVGNISGNAKSLVIDLGNGLETFFRE